MSYVYVYARLWAVDLLIGDIEPFLVPHRVLCMCFFLLLICIMHELGKTIRLHIEIGMLHAFTSIPRVCMCAWAK